MKLVIYPRCRTYLFFKTRMGINYILLNRYLLQRIKRKFLSILMLKMIHIICFVFIYFYIIRKYLTHLVINILFSSYLNSIVNIKIT